MYNSWYIAKQLFYSGIKITRGNEGITDSGDGTNRIIRTNVLDDYSVIYLNGSEQSPRILFHCVSGLASITDDEFGGLYFNNMSLPYDNCNGFLLSKRANITIHPGVLNILLCRKLTTSTEGVYTCRLMNSSMMYQSVRVGVYFSGRSESLYS